MAASNQGTSPAENTSRRELVGTRTFDAPRELVFSMFSKAEHLAKWWGPFGFRTTTYEFDFKPGGVWRFVMHGPDGTDYKNHIVFLEIAKPERIVYKHKPVSDGELLDFDVTITLAAEGQKTNLVWRTVFASPEELQRVNSKYGADKGLTQTISRLEHEVSKLASSSDQPAYPPSGPKRRDFIITRTFDASREQVFDCWTDAAHLRRWWGPKGSRINVHALDFRPGGQFLYSLHVPDGAELWGKFVYREILPPERIVFVFSFSDPQGSVLRAPFSSNWPLEVLTTVTLGEQFGLTALTLLGRPLNATGEEWELFDSMLMSMHEGYSGTFDQLSEFLPKSGSQ